MSLASIHGFGDPARSPLLTETVRLLSDFSAQYRTAAAALLRHSVKVFSFALLQGGIPDGSGDTASKKEDFYAGAFFKCDQHYLAAGGHVGDRRLSDLPCHQKGHGANPAAAHGVRRHSGKPAPVRRRHSDL